MMDYLIALAFLLTPLALVLHLSVGKNKSKAYKARVAYVYGGIWAIAFGYYFWNFVNL